MLSTDQIQSRLAALGAHAHDGSARAAWAVRLDNLLAPETITTREWSVTRRKFRNADGETVDFNLDLTPYLGGIMDACDMPNVRVVAVKGPGRSGKTVGLENKLLKHFDVGPRYDVLWYMQDKDAVDDYVEERGEDMLKMHPGINEQVNWTDRRNSRKRKRVGQALLQYLHAAPSTTRGKASPLIMADEVDGYSKRVRKAIITLLRQRQKEFGNTAKLLVGSHPDAGPEEGVDEIIASGIRHVWHVVCPHCGGASAVCGAHDQGDREHVLTWNVSELLDRTVDLDTRERLAAVEQGVVLTCPHEGCHATFSESERMTLMRGGRWLQPHQTIGVGGATVGDPLVADTMGFVIHAFMAPFEKLPEAARRWAEAFIDVAAGGSDLNLREVTVKVLGETYMGSTAEEQVEGWKLVKARLDSAYDLKTVPAGVRFLTAFVDVQGDRFEVRVIGWSEHVESWLIDAYAIKQWPAFGKHAAFDNIDPGHRLSDWEIIEDAVLSARYPLVSDPTRRLPIARTAINAAGQPGVTNNARVWLSGLLSRPDRKVEAWQVTLFQGAASKKAETYGKPRQVMLDDRGRALPTPIFERQPNVHELKRLIYRRMKIAEPGPGAMHTPFRLPPRYIRELVSERLVNGTWLKTYDNETLDGWVACEMARYTLRPDRFDWTAATLPPWATPSDFTALDTKPSNAVSVFDRLVELNTGQGGGDGNGARL